MEIVGLGRRLTEEVNPLLMVHIFCQHLITGHRILSTRGGITEEAGSQKFQEFL